MDVGKDETRAEALLGLNTSDETHVKVVGYLLDVAAHTDLREGRDITFRLPTPWITDDGFGPSVA